MVSLNDLHEVFDLMDLNKPFTHRYECRFFMHNLDKTKCSYSFFDRLFNRKRLNDAWELYTIFYDHIISLINHRAKQHALHAYPLDYYNDHVLLYTFVWECILYSNISFSTHYLSDFREEFIDSIKYGQAAGLLQALRQLLGYSSEWQAYEAQLQAVLAYEPPRVHYIDLVQKPDSHLTTCANVIVLAYDNTLADDQYQPALAELLKSDTICQFRIDEDEDEDDQILSLEWRQKMQQTCLRNQANRALRTALLCSASNTSSLNLGSYLWRQILYEFLEPLYLVDSSR